MRDKEYITEAKMIGLNEVGVTFKRQKALLRKKHKSHKRTSNIVNYCLFLLYGKL